MTMMTQRGNGRSHAGFLQREKRGNRRHHHVASAAAQVAYILRFGVSLSSACGVHSSRGRLKRAIRQIFVSFHTPTIRVFSRARSAPRHPRLLKACQGERDRTQDQDTDQDRPCGSPGSCMQATLYTTACPHHFHVSGSKGIVPSGELEEDPRSSDPSPSTAHVTVHTRRRLSPSFPTTPATSPPRHTPRVCAQRSRTARRIRCSMKTFSETSSVITTDESDPSDPEPPPSPGPKFEFGLLLALL